MRRILIATCLLTAALLGACAPQPTCSPEDAQAAYSDLTTQVRLLNYAVEREQAVGDQVQLLVNFVDAVDAEIEALELPACAGDAHAALMEATDALRVYFERQRDGAPEAEVQAARADVEDAFAQFRDELETLGALFSQPAP